MRVLRTPPSLTYTNVTFPEGFTLEKMSQRLSAKLPRLDPQAFMTAVTDGSIRSVIEPDNVTTLEGLLFPDTYRVSADETPTHVAQRMLDLMDLVLRQEDVVAKGVCRRTLAASYQVLIVASMIEREAKVDEDRPKIARVILNRLALGHAAADRCHAAVRAAGGRLADRAEPGRHAVQHVHAHRPATHADRQSRARLDPGGCQSRARSLAGRPDLCCPCRIPKDCHYLFYVVADEDGRHVFAATAEQHEINVQHARDLGLLG